MDAEKKIESIRNILKWWDEQLCPRCGADVKVDGKYGCGHWYPGSEKYAFEYCPKCDYKNTLDLDDRLPDYQYLDEIKKVVSDGV